ncbi:MAG: hypothetical protein GX307_05140 [Euryarchaeota archaeon]|nr:hypothetical protein [Euryarchaeota archaeon]
MEVSGMEGYSREDAIMLPHGFRHLDSNGHVDDLEMFYRQEVTATSDVNIHAQ